MQLTLLKENTHYIESRQPSSVTLNLAFYSTPSVAKKLCDRLLVSILIPGSMFLLCPLYFWLERQGSTGRPEIIPKIYPEYAALEIQLNAGELVFKLQNFPPRFVSCFPSGSNPPQAFRDDVVPVACKPSALKSDGCKFHVDDVKRNSSEVYHALVPSSNRTCVVFQRDQDSGSLVVSLFVVEDAIK